MSFSGKKAPEEEDLYEKKQDLKEHIQDAPHFGAPAYHVPAFGTAVQEEETKDHSRKYNTEGEKILATDA